MEMAAACAAFFDMPWDESTNLGSVSHGSGKSPLGNSQLQSVDQDQFCDDHSRPLKIDCLPAVMSQVIDLQHGRVGQLCGLGQNPFEVGEKRRVIKGPF